MLVPGQRMADEHGIRFRGIELAISLVGDLEGRELMAAIEPQRIVRAEARDGARGLVDLAQTKRAE